MQRAMQVTVTAGGPQQLELPSGDISSFVPFLFYLTIHEA
jgi:hypothetical protein